MMVNIKSAKRNETGKNHLPGRLAEFPMIFRTYADGIDNE